MGSKQPDRSSRRTANSSPRVLILTTFDLDEYVYDALRAGASGFLLKDVPPDQLAAGVRMVGDGDALLAPEHHPKADRGVRRLARATGHDRGIQRAQPSRARSLPATRERQ